MIEQKSKDVSLSNIELEGNIGEDSSKKVNVIETTKPSEQTQAAFGMSLPAFDFNALKPQEWISKRRETLKPWTEFGNWSRFKKPVSPQQAVSRTLKNLNHFQTNYLFVFIILAIYCVLTSPFLLFAFMAIAGGGYIIHLKNKEGNLKFFGKEVKIGQLYPVLGLISIPVFLIAGAGSALFWIIGASIFCILMHALFFSNDEPDDPFLAQMNIV